MGRTDPRPAVSLRAPAAVPPPGSPAHVRARPVTAGPRPGSQPAGLEFESCFFPPAPSRSATETPWRAVKRPPNDCCFDADFVGEIQGGNLGAYRGWELILAVDGQVVAFRTVTGHGAPKRRVTPHHAGSLAWAEASQRVPRCGTTISFSTPNDPGTSRARNPAAILSDSKSTDPTSNVRPLRTIM